MRTTRGYSLPLVIFVLAALAAAMTLMVVTLTSSAKTTGAMLGRRDSLYVCDGVVRGLMVKSRDYFATTSTPTAAGLRDFLCGPTAPGCPPIEAPTPWFPGYTIDEVAASTGSLNVVGQVPTGSFRGQMARRTDISLTVLAHKTGSNQRCRVTQSAINSEIGLFQFAVFSAMDIDMINPAPITISGRMHVNGDFMGGASPGTSMTLTKLTVSGTIDANHAGGFNIIDAATSTPVLIDNGNDSDSAGWRTNSEATWHGNVQDVAWSVPTLRLPVANSAPVQAGRDAANATLPNSGMLRVLVDPPRSGDDAPTSKERLANKAAIRIINGIWYVKDAGFPWPGKPVWSDHPAPYTSHILEEEDLVDATVLNTAPTSSSGPRRYSMYETDPVTGALVVDATPSVVSYGALLPAAASWEPAYLNAGTLAAAGANAANIANGTKTGFVDGRVQRNMTNGVPVPGPFGSTAAGRVLPMNFNVGALVAALADTTTPGELGSYFPTGLGRDAIIWIANTWPGWDNGFPDGAATKPSLPNLPALAGVPGPLCGTTGSNVFAAGAAHDPCNGARAPITAVRIWNAANISPTTLPRGLTIASNGPVYVLGDTNTGSLEAGAPGIPYIDDATKPWVPMMVAGDAVTLLSKNWSDDPRRWGTLVSNAYPLGCTADAENTKWLFGVVSGYVERSGTNEGGGVMNFPRFLECWSGETAEIHGSLVIGFRSVYQDEGFSLGPYRPPHRDWKFDPNFARPANQPPGSPSFFVSAVERWERD